MLAFFLATVAPHQAYADGAQRDQANIVYQDDTYLPLTSELTPKGLPAGTSGYYSIDNVNHKISFLLTSGDANQATTAQYVIYDFTPPANFSNPSPPEQVTIAPDAPTSSCGSSTLAGIGWVVCPVMHFLAKSMDFIYGIVASFLEVKTISTDTSSTVYKLWSIIRDFANVGFVITFLVIIYAQITSIGITNYGIKKMLPKLVVAAITINASYWLCSFAVDASNLAGYSIHSLFMSLFDSLSGGSSYDTSVPSWEIFTAAALAGGGAITAAGVAIGSAGGFGGAILLLIPVILVGMLAVLAALTVLAARQALIVCLIIISPIAILGFVLPNTEKLFEKWRSALTTLLVLFPVFSVVFSGAQLAGLAIVQTAGGNIITVILGMAVQVTPIVITPLLVKFSTSLIGKVAGIMNNPNKGLIDRTRNWAKGAAQERKNKILSDQNRLHKHNKRSLSVRSVKALDTRRRRREGWRKTYELGADNRFAATRQGEDLEVANRKIAQQKKRTDNRFAGSERGRLLTLQDGHLDAQKKDLDNLLAASAGGQRLEAHNRRADVRKQEVDNAFELTSMSQRVDRAKRIAEAEKSRIGNVQQANWDSAVQVEPGLLNMELNVKASEVKASVEKAKLEKMHSEISAQGRESEHILNLRGVDAPTRDGMLNIAHGIKSGQLEAAVATTAKSAADNIVIRNRTKALQENTVTIDNKTILEYASGISGDSGRNAILAKAKAENSAVFMEDVKNLENTMDNKLIPDNDKLRQKFESTNVLAEKLAYAKQLAKNGGPGVKAFRQLMADIGDFTNGMVSQDDMLDFKQVLASESSILAIGKDIEGFLVNTPAFDADGEPIMHNGMQTYQTFDQLRNSMHTWGNLSPTSFASQKEATQAHALKFMHDNDYEAYIEMVHAIRNNPAARGNVKAKVSGMFSVYSDSEIRAMIKDGKTPPEPGTYTGP